MKKTLETLWSAYQMEFPSKQSEEEKEVLHTLVAAEDKLLAELNGEQIRTLKVLEDCLGDLECLADKEAFIRGIRFATSYLIEAMCGG